MVVSPKSSDECLFCPDYTRHMPQPLRSSLFLRLGSAMGAVVLLAFVGLLSAVFTAETIQGSAAAINHAGSLRMLTYRIASSLNLEEAGEAAALAEGRGYWGSHGVQMEGFEARLRSPRLGTVLVSNPVLQSAYDDLLRQWQSETKPRLEGYAGKLVSGAGEALEESQRTRLLIAYSAEADRFVHKIDDFVKLLEEETERKIRRLRLVQVTILFLTLAAVFVAMGMVNMYFVAPLRELLDCTVRARRGDFSVRATHVGDDELGQFGAAFNVMAEDLSRSYAELEAHVQRKTADLERSNRSLELLYNTIRSLRDVSVVDEGFDQLLRQVEQSLGFGPGIVCLRSEGDVAAYRVATPGRNAGRFDEICQVPSCMGCFQDGATCVIQLPKPGVGAVRVISIPIKDQVQQHGVLLMQMPTGGVLEEWQTRLLEAVAHHIGMALNISQRMAQSRRSALLEERNVIARELHDSLAQSLSYMKIQLVRLGVIIGQLPQASEAETIVTQLREGVNSAYRQLRELLTTFRLSIDGQGLRVALESTVQEFSAPNHLVISLHNALDGYLLSANEEIHVHQIIREALSNVAKHAQAHHVWVRLDMDPDQSVIVTVDDDGVGLPPSTERRHHYGLAIMQERARGLGGEVNIGRSEAGGARVRLVFLPSMYRNQTEQKQL